MNILKFVYLVSINEVFIQLLGEDQRLIVVFQMLVMATQVDKSFPFPASALLKIFESGQWTK